MIDIFVEMPGASAREVEERVTKPMEKLLWEIPASSTSIRLPAPAGPWRGALLRRRGRREGHRAPEPEDVRQPRPDPAGASPPLISRARSMTFPSSRLTLWSKRYGDYELRRRRPSCTTLSSRWTRFRPSPPSAGSAVRCASISTNLVSPAIIYRPPTLPARSVQPTAASAGSFSSSNRELYWKQARFSPAPMTFAAWWLAWPTAARCFWATSPASRMAARSHHNTSATPRQAIPPCGPPSRSPFPSARAPMPPRWPIACLPAWRRCVALLPADVQLSITRNYGETAAEKSNELLFHMLISVISVAALVCLTLGLREPASSSPRSLSRWPSRSPPSTSMASR